MNEVLAQLSNTTWGLAIGAVVVVGANVAFVTRALNRLNADPADERHPGPLADEEPREGSSAGSVQIKAAAPRPRRLQPARSAGENATPEANGTPTPADVPIPADSLAMVDHPATAASPILPRPIKLAASVPKESELPEPVLASAAGTRTDAAPTAAPITGETLAPAGALVLGTIGTDPMVKELTPTPAAVPEASVSMAPEAPTFKTGLPADPSVPPGSSHALPPLTFNEPSLPQPVNRPGDVATTGRKFFAPAVSPSPAGLPANEKASAAPSDKGKETSVQSPLRPMWPPARPAGDKTPETLPGTPVVPPVPAPGELLPASEKPVDGPVAAPKPPMSFNEPLAGLTLLKPSDAPAVSPLPEIPPKIEPAGEGLIAIGQPVKLTGGVDAPLVPSAQEADDVKKKTPRTPALEPAVSGGLILIPPVESKPEPAVAKVVDLPAASVEPAAKTEAKAAPALEKASAEPMLSPGVADVPPTAAPASKPEAEAKTVKGPRVFLPGKFFGGKSKDKEPTPVEAKLEPEPAAKAPEKPSEPETPAPAAKVEAELPKITTPLPTLVVPPVEEVPVPVEAKPAAATISVPEDEKQPVATPEPVVAKAGEETPAAKQAEPVVDEATKPEPDAPKSDEVSAHKEEQATDKPEAESAKPVAEAPKTGLVAITQPKPETKPAAEKPEVKDAEVSAMKPVAEQPEAEDKAVPAFEAAVPAAEKAARSAAPVAKVPEGLAPAKPTEAPKAPVESVLPTQAAPTVEPIAEPIVSVLTPAAGDTPKTPTEASKAETPAAVPSAPTTAPAAIRQPYPVMPPNETTTNLPNNGRASAQLTLGFEITSLQLTPFFKLGSVQLKALSNVVSLHLVAAQADNPLAAGISFQIEHVDLDGSSHIKSILLKPLGESRAITAPLPKLQVDNVAVTGGGDGAPISITTSEQASTAVQLFGTFTIAAMDFTPAFEIGSLRLEPNSNTVLLRVAPSSRPTALDLPPSFEIAAVQLADGAQIGGMRLTPSGAKPA